MKELGIEEKEEYHWIVINRVSKKNSLTPDILVGITKYIQSIKNNSNLKPIVITGAGKDYFCSGYDINQIPLENPHQAAEFALNKPLDQAVKAIIKYPYPTFCLLNGSVYGGGCEIAFSCDFRYVVEGVCMCMPPAKMGLVYSLNGINRIGSIIGFQNLKRVLILADLIGFEDLKNWGAIDKHDTGIDETQTMLKNDLVKLMRLSPISVAGHKKILNLLMEREIDPKISQISNEIVLDAYLSADAREGKSAFLEKRDPIFTNK